MTSSSSVDAGRAARWSLALTQFLLILDTAVLNVAVPHIAATVAIPEAAQSWVVNAFVVPFAGLLLAAGYAADRVGRRRIMIAGLVVLAIGAVLGACAVNLPMILASRAVQGVGGAMAGAAAMSLVFSLFSGAERGRTLALFATMAGAGGVVGTIVGGTATEWLGWRSLFLLNVAAAAWLAAAVLRAIPPDVSPTGRGVAERPRLAAPAAMTVALTSVAYGLTASAGHHWTSLHVLGAFAVAGVALVAFVVVEARVSSPVIPRAVWQTPPFLRALAFAGCAQFSLTPLFLLITTYAQQQLGYGPARAGVVLLPMSALIVVFAPALPQIVHRLGVRAVMAGAFAAIGVGALWLMQLDPESRYLVAVLGPTLAIGVGVPTVAMTTSLVAASSAGTTPAGVTAGLLTTSQQVGAALGLAALPALVSGQGSYQAAFLFAGLVGLASALLVVVVPERARAADGGVVTSSAREEGGAAGVTRAG